MNPGTEESLETFIPLAFRRQGWKKVATDDRQVHDATLLDALARACYWQHLLDCGRMGSGADIARAEQIDPSVVNVLLRLPRLAPDIIEQMMAGSQPRALNLKWFQRHPLPVDWAAQRALMKRFEEGA